MCCFAVIGTDGFPVGRLQQFVNGRHGRGRSGNNQFQTCFRIYVPCAKPSIATLTLFTFVSHWNSYFDGLIFSNFPEHYPLASYLYTVVVKRDVSLLSIENYQILSMVDDRTIRCSQIIISLIPIMVVYPFAQKYFVKGMTVGSVKG